MGGYIKPGTGAFGNYSSQDSPFSQRIQRDEFGYDEDGWPSWVKAPVPTPATATTSSQASSSQTRPTSISDSDDESGGRNADDDGEDFDIGNVQYTAQDFERCRGDPEEQMRELLAGAVGDGEDDYGGEGDNKVEGFAKDMVLMPHQVRGVRWMRERESGRKRGGILADVSVGSGRRCLCLTNNRTWVSVRRCRLWRVSSRGVPRLATSVSTKVALCEFASCDTALILRIVCPLAVMDQWANECRTKTEKGLLKVVTHHGPKRAKSELAM